MFFQSPDNIRNFAGENYYQFLELMKDSTIPCNDFTDVIQSSQKSNKDMYYITDHHWNAKSGFNATNAICEELKELYGFSYNEEMNHIDNYNIINYLDLFLGSYGKKVGLHFTQFGADDFEVIFPKFVTKMTEVQPFKNEERNGSFEDTVLFKDNLLKDYYHINTYSTYGGGDFRFQIMKNNLNPNGKKILLIRDSFASVVAPFLSLNTRELHICDMRSYEDFVGEKINVEEYIKEIKPDYVIVLYVGIRDVNKDGWYDFF